MTRIFLSHSSKDNAQAVALKLWLVGQNPPLAKEIFLDLDGVVGIPPGTKWKDALRLASHRAEAIVCLLSASWEASTECIAEFRTAENLGKKIFPARLEPDTGRGPTRDWQFIDLFADSPETRTTEIDIGTDQPVSFSNEGLLRLRDELVDKRVGPDSFVWPPGGPGNDKYADRAPYRGWEPLEEVDAGVFFGRDTELVRGLDQLRHSRGFGGTQLFVILAASGAGKSSFLRAGLLPRLRRDDRSFLPFDLVVRPERNVLTGENGFARSIWKTRKRFELVEPDLGDIKEACRTDTERVCELLRDVQHAATQRLGEDDVTPPTLVLPVDQGEELFGGEAGPEAGRFLNMIAELADSNLNADPDSATIRTVHDLSLILAITIRTDRHHDLQDAPQLAGVPIVTFTDLRAMPPHQFREVILGPARRATAGGRALEIEAALVDQLVADCTAGADTLPLLALTLSRLFHDYGGDGDLLLDEYRRMGGIHGVVETEINQLLSRDQAESQRQLELLRQAFIPFLVSVDADTDQAVRRVANWDELPEQARPLLNELVSKRLLVRRDQDTADKHGAGVIEVALESLFRQWDELKKWLDEERENLKKAVALERDAKEWAQHGARDNWLLEGDRVTDAEKLLARPDFAKRLYPAQEYIRQSRAKTERMRKEKRRQQAIRKRSQVLKATVAVLIFFIVVVIAIMATLRYAEQRRNSAAWKLMSTAEQMLNGGRAGGDVLALQLLLAAKTLGAPDDELSSLANSRRNLVKIIENPSNTPVQSMAVSPNNGLIASAGDGSPVRIWDAASGKKTLELQVDGDSAPSIAFPPARPPAESARNSPDRTDSLLVTGTTIKEGVNNRGIVEVWNAEDGRQVENPVKLDGKVVGIAFSPDAHLVAAGMDNGTVYAWDRDDADAPRPLYQPNFRPNDVLQYVRKMSLEFSRDGRFIVFAGADSHVRLLNVESGEIIEDSAPSNSQPQSVAFSPGGDRVAVGRVDGTIELLDGHTLQTPLVLTEHSDNQPVTDLAFSPEDGAWLVSASDNNTIRVWNTRSHSPIGQPLTGHHGSVTSVQFLRIPGKSPWIVSGSTDGSIREWDESILVPFATDQGHVRSIAYEPDGPLAVGCGDGTISLWYPKRTDAAPRRLHDPPQGDGSVATSDAAGNSQEGCQAPSSDEARHGITSLAFNPRDKTQIVSSSADGSVKLWNVNGAEVEPLNDFLSRKPRQTMAVAFSQDGTQVVTGGYGTEPGSGLVRLWDIRSRRVLKRAATDYPVWTVAFSPDSRSAGKFVTGSGGAKCGCVQLWDAERLQHVGEPMKGQPPQDVNVVRFTPDGKYIVSGQSDGKILMWDVTGRLVSDGMSGDQNAVQSLAFSNDNGGKWMVSGDSAGKVRIWDTSNQRAVGAPFAGNPSWLTSIAFSPDNEQIVSASYDGELHVWPAPKPLENAICDMLSNTMTKENWDRFVQSEFLLARFYWPKYDHLCT